ncbi:hypothetical protein YN1_4370 [Nanoarchaeota archaeon]
MVKNSLSKINVIIYTIYLLVFILFVFLTYNNIFISNFKILIIGFGIIYLFLMPYLLKYTKNNLLKIVYLIIIIEIFVLNIKYDFLTALLTNYIFFYFFAFIAGYFLVNNKLKLSKKSLYLYIILLFLFLFAYFFESIFEIYEVDIDVTIPSWMSIFSYIKIVHPLIFMIIYESSILFLGIILFLINIYKEGEYVSLTKLNNINKYKKYLFISIFIVILIQISIAIYFTLFIYNNPNNWRFYPIFSLIFISIFEFIIYLLVYRNMLNKQENFTVYFLLIILSLIILFGEFYYTFDDYYSFFLHTRILISFFTFFSGLHYNLYKKHPKILKKALGMTIGTLIIIQLILGELLEAAAFGVPPNMDKFLLPIFYLPNIQLALGIIHGIVVTAIILILLYIHSKI